MEIRGLRGVFRAISGAGGAPVPGAFTVVNQDHGFRGASVRLFRLLKVPV